MWNSTWLVPYAISEYRSGVRLGDDAFIAALNLSSEAPVPDGRAATAAPHSPLADAPAAPTAPCVPVFDADESPTNTGFQPSCAACLRTSAVCVLSVASTTA